jgi:FAD/FMN-containing dehydrogenase
MVTTETKLSEAALQDLRAGFRGEVITAADDSYDVHRAVWNGSIDRRPAVIARCAGVADIIAALKCARDTGLTAAVRGGGHSFPGHSTCDDGLIIDLSLMRGVRVDPHARTARAQAGVLLGELDRETQAFGLAVPAGIVTHTGVAGLTLGGGIGWLTRKFGLTIDQLLSVDMVTAAGEFVRASATENADLFWGVRGGGGNFGIVTEFEFRANPLGPTVLAGPIFWPLSESPNVLRFYRDWIAEAPDDLTTIVIHRKAPPLPAIPPELHGQPVVVVAACYAGSVEEGEKVLRPLKALGKPLLDLCVPKPYVAHQAMFDPSFVRGWSYYFRSCDLATVNDDVIEIFRRNADQIQSPITAFGMFQLGGAMARIGDDETAFNGRHSGHTVNITGNAMTPAEFDAEREWVRRFWSDLEPHNVGAYVNFLMDEGEDRVRRSYGPEKYKRLQDLKRKYDPTNMFRLNQNIPPE